VDAILEVRVGFRWIAVVDHVAWRKCTYFSHVATSNRIQLSLLCASPIQVGMGLQSLQIQMRSVFHSNRTHAILGCMYDACKM
jgi:hypothetical protein